MATSESLQITKIEYSFQSSAYSPTGNNDLSTGSPTVVDLTLDEGGTGLADGAAVNSDQVDFGATRPPEFTVIAALEWFAAVTADTTVDFYWAGTNNSGVGVGNPGHVDGVDGLVSPADGATDTQVVRSMQYIGSMVLDTHTAGHVQIAEIGVMAVLHRYGQLIVFNNSGVTLCGTDDIESSVLLSGEIIQGQAT